MARQVVVEIHADTRGFRREMKRSELRVTRSFWRRLTLRFAIWRLDRDLRKHPRE